jgi:hypothetical protein
VARGATTGSRSRPDSGPARRAGRHPGCGSLGYDGCMFKFVGNVVRGVLLMELGKMSTKEAIELMELEKVRKELEKANAREAARDKKKR